MLLKILYIFCVFLFSFNLKAKEKEYFFKKTNYCIENSLGWRFYCDEEEVIEAEENEEKKFSKEEETYSGKLEKLQNQINELKAKAVLEPTEENIKNYMFLQQKLQDQATLFSDVWRRTLWNTPELDYTQKRPVSNIGKKVWDEDRTNQIEETIQNLKERFGIFFIYSTSCIYCQRYSDILKNLKNKYNIEIKGISIDGKFLSSWEKNSFLNQGQLEKLGIDYSNVPITVLFDNKLNKTVTIGYGLMTQDEILYRIYILIKLNLGEDY